MLCAVFGCCELQFVLNFSWRRGLPSDLAIKDTVHTLARYASICQSEGLVPIVEPVTCNFASIFVSFFFFKYIYIYISTFPEMWKDHQKNLQEGFFKGQKVF